MSPHRPYHHRPLMRGMVAVLWLALAMPLPAVAAGLRHRQRLTGDWGGVRVVLARHGVEVGLKYAAETFADVSGGRRRGVAYEGLASLAVDVPLARAGGWRGGRVHASVYAIQRSHGGIGRRFTGSIGDPSNIEAEPTLRLFTLWFQQTWLNGKVSLRAGQLSADTMFFTSPTAARLLNGTFAWAELFSADLPSGGPAYPLGTPGVRLEVKPTPRLSVQTAAFSGDPAGGHCTADPESCDRHGTTFSTSGGTLWLGETQFTTGRHGLPGVYKLGAWQDDGAAAGAAAPTALPAGVYGVYGVADQTLWQSGRGRRSVRAFLRLGEEPAADAPVAWYADAGVAWSGRIAGRDEVLTFGVSHADLRHGPDGLHRPGESVFELDYQVDAAPWLTVQPDLQYIVNPGGGGVADALAVGLRATMTL